MLTAGRIWDRLAAGGGSALHDRDFRLFFLGQLASLLGDGMTAVALSFAVLDLTGSTVALGLVLAARAVPMLVLLLVGGALADRLPRRALMLGTDVIRCVSQATLAALLIFGDAHLWQLMVLAAVIGAGSAFFNPASTGLVPSIVAHERLQSANALRGLAMASANIAGPALAGVIVAAAGPGWAIATDSLTYAVSALLLSRLRPPPTQPARGQTLPRQLRDGFKAVRSRPWILPTLAGIGLVNMMFTWFLVLGAVLAKRSLGGPGSWALILAGFGAGSLLGGLTALQLRPRRPLLTGLIGLSLLALPSATLALGLPALADAAASFLAGAAAMLFNALWETCLQQQIPHETLSRVSAYDWLGSAALTPLGYAIAGPIATVIAIKPTLWLATIAIILASLGPLTVKAVRDLVAPSSREQAAPRLGRGSSSRGMGIGS